MLFFYAHRFFIAPRRRFALWGATSFTLAMGAFASPTNAAKPMTETNEIRQTALASREYDLAAGPIHLKFADGEMRYLHVGNKEIVRRIYFAVRDGDWDTALPQYDHISVKAQKNGFTIDLSAHCVLPAADYKWTGKIVGTPDGKITFTASGEPGKDFKSNRIGICVLYGAPSLAGQTFETVGMDGKTITPGTFPLLVSPTLVASNFQSLHYKTAAGLNVTTSLSGQAHFDMEDQRTYSDSSFKNYAPLSYDYPAPVKKGDSKEEVVTVSVSGFSEVATAADNVPFLVRVGGPLEGVKVPQIGQATDAEKGGVFGAVNNNAAKFTGAKTLTWGYNPSLHLPDNDTFIENAVTILDQVKTAHSYAPGAEIRIAPLSFDNTHPRANPRDPRNTTEFGALWTTLMVKYMSLAGVSSAGFSVGPDGPAGEMQKELAALSGKPVLETIVGSGMTYPAPVDAFAVQDTNGIVLFLMNTTSKKQAVSIAGILPGKPGAKHDLKPFEVLTIRLVP